MGKIREFYKNMSGKYQGIFSYIYTDSFPIFQLFHQIEWAPCIMNICPGTTFRLLINMFGSSKLTVGLMITIWKSLFKFGHTPAHIQYIGLVCSVF